MRHAGRETELHIRQTPGTRRVSNQRPRRATQQADQHQRRKQISGSGARDRRIERTSRCRTAIVQRDRRLIAKRPRPRPAMPISAENIPAVASALGATLAWSLRVEKMTWPPGLDQLTDTS